MEADLVFFVAHLSDAFKDLGISIESPPNIQENWQHDKQVVVEGVSYAPTDGM